MSGINKTTAAPKAIIILVAIAFATNGVWVNLVGYGSAFSFDSSITTVQNLGRSFFFLSCLMAGSLAIAFPRVIELGFKAFFLIFAFISLFGTALLAISPQVSSQFGNLTICLGFSMVAFGSIWNILSIYRLLVPYGSFSAAAIVFIVSAVIAKLAFQFIQSFLPSPYQIWFALLFCVIAPLVLFIANRGHLYLLEKGSFDDRGNTSTSAYSRKDALAARRLSLHYVFTHRRQFVLIVGAALVMVSSYGLSDNGIWGGIHTAWSPDFSAFLLVPIAAVPAILVAMVVFLAFSKRIDLQKYQLPFIVLITGYILLVALDILGMNSDVSSIAQMAVFLYCHMLSPLTVWYCAKTLPNPVVQTVGYMQVLTYAFAFLWAMFLEGSGIGTSLIILLITYVLILFIMVTNKETPLPITESIERDGAVRSSSLLAERDRISTAAGLTSRETEILGFLLQGRSIPYITKELIVSEGTVRTHVRHIYHKSGVHSKQELLDLMINRGL